MKFPGGEYRPSVALLILKDDDRGDSALTKWFYGFNSRLVLGPLGSYERHLKMVVVGACMH